MFPPQRGGLGPAAGPRRRSTRTLSRGRAGRRRAGGAARGGGGLFPIRSPVCISNLQAEGVKKKLRGFSEELAAAGQEALALGAQGPAALDSLVQRLAGGGATGGALSGPEASLVSLLLEWPASHAFPALDVLKNVLLLPAAVLAGLGPGFVSRALDRAQELAQDPGAPAATLQTGLRVLANAAAADPAWVRQREADVLAGLAACCRSESKGVRLAWSTVLLNVCALRAAGGGAWSPDEKLPVVSGALELVRVSFAFQDPEPVYRALCALGTCALGDADSAAAAKGMGAAEALSAVRGMGVEKVAEAARALADVLGLPS